MIVSRVLPSLIKLNRVIKLSTIAKTQTLIPSSFSLIKVGAARFNALEVREMSTNLDADLNDPKRHFDYQQLIERKDKGKAIVIDVREHSEINETGKIPGSIHIPLAELGKALGDMPDEEFKTKYSANKPQKDNEIIFSCKAGGRSLKALRLGLELGYSNAGNYKGGWLDWAEKTGQTK